MRTPAATIERYSRQGVIALAGSRLASREGKQAIVTSLVAVFHMVAPGSGGTHTRAIPTATFAALPGPRGQWVTVNGLAGGIPAIVPSDPRVIYEVFDGSMTSAGPPVLKRSSDGGATWQPLPIPGGQVQSSTMGKTARVVPSPTNPILSS